MDKIDFYLSLDKSALDYEVRAVMKYPRDTFFHSHMQGYYTTSMSLAWNIVKQMRKEDYSSFREFLIKVIKRRTKNLSISYADILEYMEPIDVCIAAILTVKEPDGQLSS